MAQKSFLEILADELRVEIRREMDVEFRERQDPFKNDQMRTPTLNPQTHAQVGADRLQSWLLTHLTPRASTGAGASTSAGVKLNRWSEISKTFPRRASERRAPTENAKKSRHSTPPQRLALVHTTESLAALELFRRWNENLPEFFLESELKAAYRRLALRLHPDRRAGPASPGPNGTPLGTQETKAQTEAFIAAHEAYQILLELVQV